MLNALVVPVLVEILLIALLPGVGTGLGCLMGELVDPPRWLVGATLHAAAGIAIGLVSIELMPRALNLEPRWLLALAFVIGSLASVGLATLMERVETGGEAGSALTRMVFFAVFLDLFVDGILTGIGSAVDSSVGRWVAISQVIGNLPGGFAVTARLKREKTSPKLRAGLGLSFLFPSSIAAAFGFLLLNGASMTTKAIALGIVSGLLLLTTIEDTVPAGDQPKPPRWYSTLFFAAGFCFLLVFAA